MSPIAQSLASGRKCPHNTIGLRVPRIGDDGDRFRWSARIDPTNALQIGTDGSNVIHAASLKGSDSIKSVMENSWTSYLSPRGHDAQLLPAPHTRMAVFRKSANTRTWKFFGYPAPAILWPNLRHETSRFSRVPSPPNQPQARSCRYARPPPSAHGRRQPQPAGMSGPSPVPTLPS